MTIQRNFRRFHDAIKLSREDNKYSEARAKDDSICSKLKEAFNGAGYPVIETFIQGSLKTATTIKHPKNDFDIDRALVIDASTAPDDPVEVKKLVCSVLEKRGFKNVKIKMPCVTADYCSLNLHIDIVVYRKNGSNYELAVGKRNSSDSIKEWSPSDPIGLLNKINDKSGYIGSSEEKLRQYKRLVRYIKRWRDEKFEDSVCKKVYSIGLTTMLKEQYKDSFDDDGKPIDLQALRDSVEAMLYGGYFRPVANGNYRVTVNLPVLPYRDIFDNSSFATATQLRNKLFSMLSKLDAALQENSLEKQCNILRDLFGEDFGFAEDIKRADESKVVFSNAGSVGTSQGA